MAALQPTLTLSNWTPTTVDITISSPYASGTMQIRLAVQEPTGLSFQYDNPDRSTWIKGSGPTNNGDWEHTFSQALTGTGNNTITLTGIDANQPYVAYGWCDDGGGATSDVALCYRSAPAQNGGNRRIRLAKPTQETIFGARASKVVSGGTATGVSFPLNDIAEDGDMILIAFAYPLDSPSNYLINRTPSMASSGSYTGIGNGRVYRYTTENWNGDGSENTFSGDWQDQANLPTSWSAAIMCIRNGENYYRRTGLSSSSGFGTDIAGPPRLWLERLDSIIGGLTRSEEISFCYFYMGTANTVNIQPYMEEQAPATSEQPGPPAHAITDETSLAGNNRLWGALVHTNGLWSNRDWISYFKLETALTTPAPVFVKYVLEPEPAKYLNFDFSGSLYNQLICTGDANWPYGYAYYVICSQEAAEPNLSYLKQGWSEFNSSVNVVASGHGYIRAKNANDREGTYLWACAPVLLEKQDYHVYFFLENHERSTQDSRDAEQTNLFYQVVSTPDGPDESVYGVTEQLEVICNPAVVTQGYRPAELISVTPDVWQDGLQNVVITTANIVDHTATRVWVRNRAMPITARTTDTLTITADQQDLIDEELYRLALTDYYPYGQNTLQFEHAALLGIPEDPFVADVVFQTDFDDVPTGTTTTTRGWGYYNPNKIINHNPLAHGFGINFGKPHVCQLIDDPSDALWGRKYVRSRAIDINFSSSSEWSWAYLMGFVFPDHSNVSSMPLDFPLCLEFWVRLSDEYLVTGSIESITVFMAYQMSLSGGGSSGFRIQLQRGGYPGGADPIGRTGVTPEAIANGYLGFVQNASVDYPPADPARWMNRGLGWQHLAYQRNDTGRWDVWLDGQPARNWQEAALVIQSFNSGWTGPGFGSGTKSQFDWKGIRVTRDVVRYTPGVAFTPQFFRPLKPWVD